MSMSLMSPKYQKRKQDSVNYPNLVRLTPLNKEATGHQSLIMTVSSKVRTN